jgi:arylsulfatase A-like enzyme
MNKSILSFIIYLFFCLIQKQSIAQEKPNVLFISIDDLNDYIACMKGSIRIPTPNIDRLLKSGTLFTNAHCQAPICGPSRASLLSGLYPTSSGNYLQVSDKDIKKSNEKIKSATFLPDYFEQNGYRTFGAGKVFHQGDKALVFDEFGTNHIKDLMGPKPETRFKYAPIPKKGVEMTQTDWGPYPDADSLMTDYISAEWVIEKLKKEHDKPFFMALGFVRPHVPLYAPQKWFNMFPIEKIKTPPYLKSDLDDVPAMGIRVADAPMMPTTEMLIENGQWPEVIQAYSACVAFVDAQLGKVLDQLENSKYANNTVIVLWADHGYHLGEKNRFAKQALWERDTHTVLIINDKRNPSQAQKVDEPVQLLDIYPTLLDICKLPSNQMNEGHSLVGLINKTTKNWPYAALSFYGVGNVSIRDKSFRYIQYEDGSNELYDLNKDPNEWKNLASEKVYFKKIKKLKTSIPEKWADNSPFSKYTFNAYFIEKSNSK